LFAFCAPAPHQSIAGRCAGAHRTRDPHHLLGYVVGFALQWIVNGTDL